MADPKKPCLDHSGRLVICRHKQVKTLGGQIHPDLREFPERIKLTFNFKDFTRHLRFMVHEDLIPKLCPVVLAPYYEQFVKLFLPKEPILAKFAAILTGKNIELPIPDQVSVEQFMKAFMEENRVFYKEDILDMDIAERRVRDRNELEDLRQQLRLSDKTLKQCRDHNKELQASMNSMELQLKLVRNNLQRCQQTNKDLAELDDIQGILHAQKDLVSIGTASLISTFSSKEAERKYQDAQIAIKLSNLQNRERESAAEIKRLKLESGRFRHQSYLDNRVASILKDENTDLKKSLEELKEKCNNMDSSALAVETQKAQLNTKELVIVDLRKDVSNLEAKVRRLRKKRQELEDTVTVLQKKIHICNDHHPRRQPQKRSTSGHRKDKRGEMSNNSRKLEGSNSKTNYTSARRREGNRNSSAPAPVLKSLVIIPSRESNSLPVTSRLSIQLPISTQEDAPSTLSECPGELFKSLIGPANTTDDEQPKSPDSHQTSSKKRTKFTSERNMSLTIPNEHNFSYDDVRIDLFEA